MTTVAFLINKTDLEIDHLSPTNLLYIEDFINYLLYPYKQLNCFRFNTFSRQYIDGTDDSNKLNAWLLKKHNTLLFIISSTSMHITPIPLTTIDLNIIQKNIGNYGILFGNIYK